MARCFVPLPAAGALLLAACALAAQEPAFEVASIRPTPPDAQCGMIEPLPGGSLRIDCLPLHTIVMWAYNVQDFQVTGGPPWVSATRWDILAKPPAAGDAGEPPKGGAQAGSPSPPAQENLGLTRRRLRTLLADRFGLVLRHEMREHTIYVMTVAKSGSKLKEAEPGPIRRRPGQIVGSGVTIGALAQFLAVDLREPVTDETGLTGKYAFTLEWAADPARDAGPSVFTAIQEQLGLRLDARKAPVETLVIERASKPDAP